jgi:3-deoxy-D-manno-octulosonic-acid transferase
MADSLTPRAPVLIWLHADSAAGRGKLLAFWAVFSQQGGGLQAVLTYPEGLPAPNVVAGCTAQPLPKGGRQAAVLARLFAAHRPVATLWHIRTIAPTLVRLATEMECPILLADADYPRVSGFWSRLPGMGARILRKVPDIFVPTEEHARLWLQAGALPAQVRICGSLNDAPTAAPCNEAERDQLADALRQRGVWAALTVPEAEESYVIAALRETLRESHRAVLILNPADPRRGPALRAELADRFQTALRSADDLITPETQVYIADTEEERGLWYRLAVACFIGGTLSRGGAGCSPFEAAGLGCAIVHGRETGRYGGDFARLADVQAARRILRPDALGRTLCAVLRPDAAALLATRAWEVVSDGAAASEAISDVLLRHVQRARHANA